MTIYIALLRGINVGGNNKIKMADLRLMCEQMGLSRVQTYIQSGNILFESELDPEPLRLQIEQEIQTVFDMQVPVILRTAQELEQIIQNCPFSEEEVKEAELASESETLYVTLLLKSPLPEAVERLRGLNTNSSDKFHVSNTEVYLLFCQSIRNSKLANHLNKLDGPSTTRNWKTMNKLVSLAQAMRG